MRTWLLLVFALVAAACSASSTSPAPVPSSHGDSPAVGHPAGESEKPVFQAGPTEGDFMPTSNEVATFATGCFWCTEAIFQRLDGVLSVRSGYTGGKVDKPSYDDVCRGTTGHAEAVEVTFDPKKVSYETLLDWFWRMHDPTTLNRQGADVGTQYRSAIFWHSEAQRATAETSKADAQDAFKDPIVTEITKAGPFFAAEDYHQGYYNANTTQGYCRAVIAPKLHKLGLDGK